MRDLLLRLALFLMVGALFHVCYASGDSVRYKKYIYADTANSGWTRLNDPPSDSKQIILDADNPQFIKLMSIPPFRVTWFAKSKDKYLLEIQLDKKLRCTEEVVLSKQKHKWSVIPVEQIWCMPPVE